MYEKSAKEWEQLVSDWGNGETIRRERGRMQHSEQNEHAPSVLLEFEGVIETIQHVMDFIHAGQPIPHVTATIIQLELADENHIIDPWKASEKSQPYPKMKDWLGRVGEFRKRLVADLKAHC
jgi:hypothetical protein